MTFSLGKINDSIINRIEFKLRTNFARRSPRRRNVNRIDEENVLGIDRYTKEESTIKSIEVWPSERDRVNGGTYRLGIDVVIITSFTEDVIVTRDIGYEAVMK